MLSSWGYRPSQAVLHFDNSKCHTAQHVQEHTVSHRCVRLPHLLYSADLAIQDFCLFGRLKQQPSKRILNSEENVVETITEILRELRKDEAKSAFVPWKERCQWVADHNERFPPNWLNTKLLCYYFARSVTVILKTS
jgi:hypothetical protein